MLISEAVFIFCRCDRKSCFPVSTSCSIPVNNCFNYYFMLFFKQESDSDKYAKFSTLKPVS